jgi:hypothetical protein
LNRARDLDIVVGDEIVTDQGMVFVKLPHTNFSRVGEIIHFGSTARDGADLGTGCSLAGEDLPRIQKTPCQESKYAGSRDVSHFAKTHSRIILD